MLTAVLQMNSTSRQADNLEQAGALLARAAAQGAGLAVLPECFAFMQAEGRLPSAQPLRGELTTWLGARAKEHGMWIVGGSFSQSAPGSRLVYNTCPVLNPQGELVAHYQKIHLFDLTIPGRKKLLESRHTRPGRRRVVVDTPMGGLGLSICYDLRFPELYRILRLKGASVLAAPSAFTYTTGKDHWELLIRARALENACYMLAAAQTGVHGRGRKSWGHAMIVDPWGEIIASCDEGPGMALAEITPQTLARFRRKLDSTQHAICLPKGWAGP